MDSMVTPSVHGAGFATVASSGPNWAAYGSSEAALETHAAIQASSVYGGIQSHFVRDSIERQDFRNELRFERRNRDGNDSGSEVAILKAEVARLRDDKQDAANQAILAALAALKKP